MQRARKNISYLLLTLFLLMKTVGLHSFQHVDEDFEKYCEKVESITQSVWGGQLEINAISAALKLPIDVFSADSPVVTMGKEADSKKKLRISYHKHYFSLGEHYNSIVPK